MAISDRVALITGCARKDGIGAAMARALAATGMSMVVSGRTEIESAARTEAPGESNWRGLDSLVDELQGQGRIALPIRGDVSVEEDANRMIAETLARYGRLDVLINNAAASNGAECDDIENIPPDAWDKVITVNLRGTFLMCRAAVASMRKTEWGRIINIASVLAYHPRRKNRVAYGASKAAIIGFTKSLAFDLGGTGITVNAIAPGSILTSKTAHAIAGVASQDFAAGIASRAKSAPLGRIGMPDDIAAMAVFLASEQSSYITGQAFGVNGGVAGSQ